jgi:hopanoid biosynthesis associated protein HpnK
MPPQLIVNADDFGRSTEINQAVIRAHREGVLNSASLMVAGPAAAEAIELARQNPALAVGLHLVVVDGPAVLPPERIPHLVDSRGRFPDQPVRLGLRYAFSRRAKCELKDEITAQFEQFAATGLALSHVDGHQHMHLHPVVYDLMLPLARKLIARRIRIVRDDLALALRYDPARRAAKSLSAAIFAALALRCRRCPIPALPRTYGFYQSGNVTKSYVLLALQEMHESAEMYFHPTVGQRLDALGPNAGDLETLLDQEVRAAIEARGLLATFPADTTELRHPAPSTSLQGGSHREPVATK